MADPVITDFIRRNLRLQPPPGLPELQLYLAHSGSGLSRLSLDETPYWAWPWPGGAALARFLLDQPQTVRGLGVLDVGTGCGVAAIAAAKAGARRVTANDIDANAIAAATLNAAANGVRIDMLCDDILGGDAPEADIILVGDLFYEVRVAMRLQAFAARCLSAGKTVLAGDVGRTQLPRERLEWMAAYDVTDFGDGAASRTAGVYRFTR